MMRSLDLAMPASGLTRNVVRMASYWLAGTLLLWVSDPHLASASWASKFVYLMLGSNCIVLFAGIAKLAPRPLADVPPVYAMNTAALAALEVLAMVLVVITTGKILA